MITVREATAEDITAIAEIGRSCFAEPWTERQLEEELCHDFARLTVALEDEEIIGFCDLHIVCDDAHINEIAVEQRHRRRGAAALMVKKMIDMSQASGCAIISLEVRSGNEPAIALYKSFGFETAGVRKKFYREPVEDAYTMIMEF